MEKKVYIVATKKVEHGRLLFTSHPDDKRVIGVYSSITYARKVASKYYAAYVICVYPNGFRKIYMN